ncbi:sensor histidine kinase [Hoyosella sp. YIM 151337]|uniref:sensor histidine kinase n=1 Tax=Hoyosella sp. YIM 151337 TaxID=2992742 RepID=UPI0035A9A453
MNPALRSDAVAPAMHRRVRGRVVGGVAGGVADHLGVDEQRVRLAFVLLAAAAGIGVVAYGLLWILTPPGSDTEPLAPEVRRQAIGLATIGGAVAVAFSLLSSGALGAVLVPVLVAIAGAALVWREFDVGAPRSMLGLSQRPTALTWVRVIGGVTLVVLGLSVIWLDQVDFGALRSSLMAVLVTLAGVAVLTIPLWLRMWRALNEERAARIRTEERDEIASHLHDSVLQTLALIQKRSERPAEVQRLARMQERELRRWLFSAESESPESLAAALKSLAGEVEDQYGVTIQPVTVGDVRISDSPANTALLGAVREALVNAAKHSGESNVDLFAEVEPEKVSVFVRDRGKGFDPDAVPADRQGLAKSVRQRMERRGGSVDIRTGLGKGTEVRIYLDRDDTEPEEEK